MSLKPLAVLALATFCFVPMLDAQKSFWDSKNAYLGQPRPGDTPQIFAPGLLVDSGTIAMDRIAFSLDGKEIYYPQFTDWGNVKEEKTKVFRYDGHKWNGPTILNERFYAQALSPDGKTMYLSGENPHQEWVSKRTDGGWSAPAIFLEKPYNLIDLMPTNSGTFYLASDPDADDKKNGIAFSFSKLTFPAMEPRSRVSVVR